MGDSRKFNGPFRACWLVARFEELTPASLIGQLCKWQARRQAFREGRQSESRRPRPTALSPFCVQVRSSDTNTPNPPASRNGRLSASSGSGLALFNAAHEKPATKRALPDIHRPAQNHPGPSSPDRSEASDQFPEVRVFRLSPLVALLFIRARRTSSEVIIDVVARHAKWLKS